MSLPSVAVIKDEEARKADGREHLQVHPHQGERTKPSAILYYTNRNKCINGYMLLIVNIIYEASTKSKRTSCLFPWHFKNLSGHLIIGNSLLGWQHPVILTRRRRPPS